MSKKRHNFFRLCSFVLAFMLTFTNMPAVAYATDGYSADTGDAIVSETGAITEDGEVLEEVEEPSVEEEVLPVGDEDVPEEEEEPAATEDEDLPEEVEEKDYDLNADGQYVVKFYNQGGTWLRDVNKYEGTYLTDSGTNPDIPSISTIVGQDEVFGGWLDMDDPAGPVYSNQYLTTQLPIMRAYNLKAVVYSKLTPEFAHSSIEVAYGDTTEEGDNDPTGIGTGTVLVYSTTDTDYISVDEDTGFVTGIMPTPTDPTETLATVSLKVYTNTGSVTEPVPGIELGSASYNVKVVKRPITITPDDNTTAVYNGQPQSVETYTVATTTPLATGDEIDSLDIDEKTNAGTYSIGVSNVVIKHGEDVVTGYYEITSGTGTLTIAPADLTVTWLAEGKESVDLDYTGSAQAPTPVDIEVEGDLDTPAYTVGTYSNAQATLTISAISIGSYYAKFNITTGADNYNVINQITPFRIVPTSYMYVEAVGQTGVYNGSAYTMDSLSVYTDSTKTTPIALTDCVISYKTKEAEETEWTDWGTTIPSFINAGTYSVEVTVKNTNYKDTTAEATITITPRTMYVTAAGYEGPVDGDPHAPVIKVYENADYSGLVDESDYTVKYEIYDPDTETWSEPSTTFTPQVAPCDMQVRVTVDMVNYTSVQKTVTIKITGVTLYVTATSFDGEYTGTAFTPVVKVCTDEGMTGPDISGDCVITYRTSDDDGETWSAWGSTAPSRTEPGKTLVDVHVVREYTSDYKPTGDASATINIKKRTPVVAVSVIGWEYTGNVENTPVPTYQYDSVDIPSADYSVTYYYKEANADDSAYTTTAKTDVGTYVVKAVFAESDYYSAATAISDPYSITKTDIAPAQITKNPVATSETLTFNSTSQSLLSQLGECSVGTFKYLVVAWVGADDAEQSSSSLNKNAFTTGGYTALNAGKYAVFYYIQGDDNHKDTQINYVGPVSIGKANIDVSDLSVVVTGWTYGDSYPETLTPPLLNKIPSGAAATGAITYYYKKSTDENYSVWYGSDAVSPATPSFTKTTKPGTYYMYAHIDGGVNYNSADTAENTNIVVARKVIDVSVGDIADKTYTGSPVTTDGFTIVTNSADKVPGGADLPAFTGTFTIDPSPATNVGEYTVSIATISDTDDYYTAGERSTTTFNIVPATFSPTLTGDWVLNTPLTFTGNDQNLIKTGTGYSDKDTTIGRFEFNYKYSVNEPTGTVTIPADDDAGWSTTNHYGNAAGYYDVFYRVDRNYLEPAANYEHYYPTDAYIGRVFIGKAVPYFYGGDTPELVSYYDNHYNNTAKTLIKDDGTPIGGTVMFSIDFEPLRIHPTSPATQTGVFDTKDELLEAMRTAHWYSIRDPEGAEALKAVDAGYYHIYYYIKGDENWTDLYFEDTYGWDAFYAGYAVINPSFLTITANDTWIVYGENPDSAYTCSIAPYVPGQYYNDADEELLGIKYNQATGVNVGTYKIQPESVQARLNTKIYWVDSSHVINPADHTSWVVGNYLIYDYYEGTLTILPKPVTVYIDDSEKVYNYDEVTQTGADPDFTYTVVGMANNEDPSGLITVPDIIRTNTEVQTVKVDPTADPVTDTELPYENVLQLENEDELPAYTFSAENSAAYKARYGEKYGVDYGTRLSTPDINADKTVAETHGSYGSVVQGNYIVTFVSGDFTILYDQIDLTEPTAIEGLYYDHRAKQDLVDYGNAAGGNMYFAVVDWLEGADGQYTQQPAPAISKDADTWLLVDETTTETAKDFLRRTNDGIYDVYYWVEGTPDNGFKSIPAKGTTTVPIGPITVTIDKSNAIVVKEPVARERMENDNNVPLSYDTYLHTLIYDDPRYDNGAVVENGRLYYMYEDCTHDQEVTNPYDDVDPHDPRFAGKWQLTIPEDRRDITYDVYYYVEGSEVVEEDGSVTENLRYVTSPIYGPIHVTIAETYSEVEDEPVPNTELIYDNSIHTLIDEPGTVLDAPATPDGQSNNTGTMYYAVKRYAEPHDADWEDPYAGKDASELAGQWDLWGTSVLDDYRPGYYDVYYYIEGTEVYREDTETWETGLLYKSTPILGPIEVQIGYIVATPADVYPYDDLVYNEDKVPQPLLEQDGVAVNGTMLYRWKFGEDGDWSDWSEDIPKQNNAGTYYVEHYAKGSYEAGIIPYGGDAEGLLYVDSEHITEEIVIDKRHQDDILEDHVPYDNSPITVTAGQFAPIRLENLIDYEVAVFTEENPIEYAITSVSNLGCKIVSFEGSHYLVIGDTAGEITISIYVPGDENHYEYPEVYDDIKVTIKAQNDQYGGDDETGEDGTFIATFGDADWMTDDGINIEYVATLGKSVPVYTYTGSAIKPNIIVNNGGRTLVEGKDYTISYKNNVKASGNTKMGYAYAKVTGKGNLKGSRTLEFYIEKADISDAIVGNLVVEFGKKMAPVVTYEGLVLKAGTDYTTSVNLNTKINQTEPVEVTITGKGNFDEETSQTFEVEVVTPGQMRPISVTMPTDINKRYYYNGEAVYLTEDELYVCDKATGAQLELGYDYDVTYSSNVNAGKVKVTVTGLGIYKGTIKKTFVINPAKYAPIDLTPTCKKALLTDGVEYRNYGATPELYLVAYLDEDHPEVELKLGKDYKVTYANNKRAGSQATYKVTFINNYKGNKSFEGGFFKINPSVFDSDLTEVALRGSLVYNSKKTKASNYLPKPGKNLFVTHAGSLIKTTEYKVSYYMLDDEFDLVPIGDGKGTTVQPGDQIIVKVVPRVGNPNYVLDDEGVYRAFTILAPKASTVDISKAKIAVVDKVTRKKVNPEYTGVAIDPMDSGKYALTMTIGTGKNKVVYTSDGFGGTPLIDEDELEVQVLNNVRRGLAKVVISAYDDSDEFSGSCTGTFTIGQNLLTKSLLNYFDFFGIGG